MTNLAFLGGNVFFVVLLISAFSQSIQTGYCTGLEHHSKLSNNVGGLCNVKGMNECFSEQEQEIQVTRSKIWGELGHWKNALEFFCIGQMP